jgi:hypothetical protein
MSNRVLVNTAADGAEQFISNPDPNLRYLGLISITRLMRFSKATISLHRETLASCLESDDQMHVFIAVDLLESIVRAALIGDVVATSLGRPRSGGRASSATRWRCRCRRSC